MPRDGQPSIGTEVMHSAGLKKHVGMSGGGGFLHHNQAGDDRAVVWPTKPIAREHSHTRNWHARVKAVPPSHSEDVEGPSGPRARKRQRATA